MILRAALLILQSHQKWRLGKSDYMNMPSEITEAINTIIQYHVGSTTALIDQVPNVGKMVELSDKVTRLEVVDKQGRVYSQWNCSIELSYQDDGKTLKIFVNN